MKVSAEEIRAALISLLRLAIPMCLLMFLFLRLHYCSYFNSQVFLVRQLKGAKTVIIARTALTTNVAMIRSQNSQINQIALLFLEGNVKIRQEHELWTCKFSCLNDWLYLLLPLAMDKDIANVCDRT
jgi:hypothetical protein